MKYAIRVCAPQWPSALYRVEAPTFVAGFVVENGRIKSCAPILRKHLSTSMAKFQLLCQRKGWQCRMVL